MQSRGELDFGFSYPGRSKARAHVLRQSPGYGKAQARSTGTLCPGAVSAIETVKQALRFLGRFRTGVAYTERHAPGLTPECKVYLTSRR